MLRCTEPLCRGYAALNDTRWKGTANTYLFVKTTYRGQVNSGKRKVIIHTLHTHPCPATGLIPTPGATPYTACIDLSLQQARSCRAENINVLMPIKLPKSLARRRSSGNALEEFENPPEPSFRVFERPSDKSFDGGNSLKRMSQARPLSAGHLEDHIYVDVKNNTNPSNRYDINCPCSITHRLTHSRGSGGTNNSASSGHDNSSVSARYSSSSTLPSSTDTPLDDRHSPHPIDTRNIPLPAIPGSSPRGFKAGGRTFSFGRKKAQATLANPPSSSSPKNSDSPGFAHVTRERALTESSYASGSTATPPKLLEGGLDFGSSDLDGFGSMFDNVGRPKSQKANETMALGVRATESPVR